MSQKNVEIARRAYAALAEEGIESMLAYTDPEFEVTTPPSLASEPNTFRGHDGIRRWFGAFSDGLEGVYFEGREFTAAGTRCSSKRCSTPVGRRALQGQGEGRSGQGHAGPIAPSRGPRHRQAAAGPSNAPWSGGPLRLWQRLVGVGYPRPGFE